MHGLQLKLGSKLFYYTGTGTALIAHTCEVSFGNSPKCLADYMFMWLIIIIIIIITINTRNSQRYRIAPKTRWIELCSSYSSLSGDLAWDSISYTAAKLTAFSRLVDHHWRVSQAKNLTKSYIMKIPVTTPILFFTDPYNFGINEKLAVFPCWLNK